ncbi:hypothetical protein LINPERHAP1_LOCUS16798 [Linum perenne]|jgi:MFS family permease
MLILL